MISTFAPSGIVVITLPFGVERKFNDEAATVAYTFGVDGVDGVEGVDEDDVKDVAKLLGFSWSKAVFGSVTVAYQAQYPNGDASKLVTVPCVTFADSIPAIISGE